MAEADAAQEAPAPAGTAAPGPASPTEQEAYRATLLAAFAAWLDQTLADEPAPHGLDETILAEFLAATGAPEQFSPPAGCSLHDLWSALTALTQEVKLQGRTFRQLTEAVAPVADLDRAVHAAIEAHGEALATVERMAGEVDATRRERQRDAVRDAERRAVAGMVEALLDTRDRLVRGLAAAEPPRLGWLAHLLAPSARRAVASAAALRQGYALTLGRLDECLREQGLREVGGAGAPFDPRCMRAAEVVPSSAVPDGTVLEVLRPGYESDTGVVRVAEVRVARTPAAAAVPPPSLTNRQGEA
jgi:molecular chaperone GrpE